MRPLLLSVRGGLGVGDTRVIVVINAGRGVMGWVVVVASLTQMVGLWVRSWSWLSCCQHKWWGCGGGVMVVGIVSLMLVVGSWLWLWSWWWLWLWLWWVVNMGGRVVVGCVVVIAVASLTQVVGWWVVVVSVLMVVAGSSMLVVGRWLSCR